MRSHRQWRHPPDLIPLAENGRAGIGATGTTDTGGGVPRSPDGAVTAPWPPATASQRIVFIEAKIPDLEDLRGRGGGAIDPARGSRFAIPFVGRGRGACINLIEFWSRRRRDHAIWSLGPLATRLPGAGRR